MAPLLATEVFFWLASILMIELIVVFGAAGFYVIRAARSLGAAAREAQALVREAGESRWTSWLFKKSKRKLKSSKTKNADKTKIESEADFPIE